LQKERSKENGFNNPCFFPARAAQGNFFIRFRFARQLNSDRMVIAGVR
jgi:hypothetical protein